MKNFDFSQILGKISILVKFLEKFWFWSNFHKKFRFWSNFGKIASLVKLSNKFDFSKISKNFDFGLNFRKISTFGKFSKKFWFRWIFWKIIDFVHPILLKSSKNSYFSQIFEKFQFWSYYRKFRFRSIFEKFRFWSIFRLNLIFSIFRKISNSVKISKNFNFGQNFRKISI